MGTYFYGYSSCFSLERVISMNKQTRDLVERKKMTSARIALLSNVNMNFVIRLLRKEVEVYESEGYGNELGIMMDETSSYHSYAPEYTFLIMDLMELLEHGLEETAAAQRIENWFGTFENCVRENQVYYVSDAYLWGAELDALADCAQKTKLERLWLERLQETCKRYSNVRIFPYRRLVERVGEERAFSLKMWYMGRILLSNDAQKMLCEEVLNCLDRERRTPKKVLLLDLDNTLWGGLAGEADHVPVVLSEEHAGLAYKNLQRVIFQMQQQGVLLGIVSKNNEGDALEIIRNHPHMVLRENCFVAKKINWKPKQENILEIAGELNLGTDSFVFWDDNPTERELVKQMLPEVEVPDFPENPEELAPAMVEIYARFFAKAKLTSEDRAKTAQYTANFERDKLQKKVANFEDYLRQLQIVITRVNPAKNLERAVQLANKTNQFNLTTERYTMQEMQEILQNEKKRVYLYQVSDRFGDNGIVAIVIVDMANEIPAVEEFAMSCRVMGKRIENGILWDVEQDMLSEGYRKLRGIYRPTSKNKPVEQLYDRLDYDLVRQHENGEKEYEYCIERAQRRDYYADLQQEPFVQ